MQCPSCGEDEVVGVEVPCLDEDGDTMAFSVCKNCDYGINEHTEGDCNCEKRLSLEETVARAQNSSKTDPTWRTDYA